MAAVEQVFGIFDAGNSRDLDQAFDGTKELVVNNCVCGFYLHQNRSACWHIGYGVSIEGNAKSKTKRAMFARL